MVGRTTLLAVPTLATGVIALAVLFLLQRLLSPATRHPGLRRLLARGPVVIVRDGLVLEHEMRRARVSPDDLRQRLRLCGITRLGQVGLAVLEGNGQISVLRPDPDIDAWLVEDVEMPHPAIERRAATGQRSMR